MSLFLSALLIFILFPTAAAAAAIAATDLEIYIYNGMQCNQKKFSCGKSSLRIYFLKKFYNAVYVIFARNGVKF